MVMLPRVSLGLVLVAALLLLAKPLWAHAVLIRTEPVANTILAQPPAEVRLWFTEPVEPKFSRVAVRDSRGVQLSLPDSQLDNTDAHQLFLPTGDLPNGLYTVVWQVVSAADGHQTAGNFPFTIGTAATIQPIVPSDPFAIPLIDALARWFNLFALALAVGGVGFRCFVWRPASMDIWPAVDQRLQRISWVGWLAVGISSVWLLGRQATTLGHRTWFELFNDAILFQVIQGTRFGLLWLIRMGLWLLFGISLWAAYQRFRYVWLALFLGGATLTTQSLYSHAAAAQENGLAILADWVHLLMSALWVGGLIQLGLVLPMILFITRKTEISPAPLVGRLVGYFSNYARIAVVGLTVTGLYAGWLQVGNIEGVTTTLYGRTLLVKLGLFVPLLTLAAINLLVTQRRLQAGLVIWVGRLRGLVAVELLLMLLILGAVGVMTAINPARNELQQRAIAAAAPTPPTPNPITAMQMADQLHVHLGISPGWVGENNFTVDLSTMADSQPVTDVTLIRLRFESQSADLGQSELRITSATDGVYRVTGSNLSAPGDWQIRMTIQRPDQFDTVVDFTPHVEPPPPATPPPMIDLTTPLPYRQPVLLVTGCSALLLGAYLLIQQRGRVEQGSRVLTVGVVILGGIFLGSAFW